MCVHIRELIIGLRVEHVSMYTHTSKTLVFFSSLVSLTFIMACIDLCACLNDWLFEAKALRRVDRSIDRSYHFIDYLFYGRLMGF